MPRHPEAHQPAPLPGKGMLPGRGQPTDTHRQCCATHPPRSRRKNTVLGRRQSTTQDTQALNTPCKRNSAYETSAYPTAPPPCQTMMRRQLNHACQQNAIQVSDAPRPFLLSRLTAHCLQPSLVLAAVLSARSCAAGFLHANFCQALVKQVGGA